MYIVFQKKITQHTYVPDQLTSPLKHNTYASIGLTTLGVEINPIDTTYLI